MKQIILIYLPLLDYPSCLTYNSIDMDGSQETSSGKLSEKQVSLEKLHIDDLQKCLPEWERGFGYGDPNYPDRLSMIDLEKKIGNERVYLRIDKSKGGSILLMDDEQKIKVCHNGPFKGVKLNPHGEKTIMFQAENGGSYVILGGGRWHRSVSPDGKMTTEIDLNKL